jgi:hypothetical protein
VRACDGSRSSVRETGGRVRARTGLGVRANARQPIEAAQVTAQEAKSFSGFGALRARGRIRGPGPRYAGEKSKSPGSLGSACGLDTSSPSAAGALPPHPRRVGKAMAWQALRACAFGLVC